MILFHSDVMKISMQSETKHWNGLPKAAMESLEVFREMWMWN